MKKALLEAMTVLLIVIASSVMAAGPYPYIADDFNYETIGELPSFWTVKYETTPGEYRHCRAADVSDELGSDPDNMIHCLKFHDDNLTGTGGIKGTKYYSVQCYRGFPVDNTEGVVTLTCDLYFKQISALFMVRVCNSEAITTLKDAAAQVLFEGNLGWRTSNSEMSSYVPGTTGRGHVSYLKTYNTSSVQDTGATYAADMWYTLKMELDCDNKTFNVYLGPKGGTLTQIITNLPWSYDLQSDPPSRYCADLKQVVFLTSTCSDEPNQGYDTEGDETVYVDNVLVTGPMPPPQTDTIAQARLLDKIGVVNMTDQIVTAGTDQVDGISGWVNGWFYIQDPFAGGPGIRVRWPSATIHEGDKVNVNGVIEQASEGDFTKHNGEREIRAAYVTVTSSDNTVPAPIAMRNSEVGGGWYGPLETPDSHGDEPRLKGVWPMNTTPDPYYYNDTEGLNSFSPLFNVGTLVTVCGKITQFCDQYEGTAACPDIYIYDGSLEFDGCNATEYPPQGVRIRISQSVWDAIVAANSSTILNVGDYVSVTGVAGAISCSNLGSTSIRNIRLVRIRKASDFVLVNDVEPPW